MDKFEGLRDIHANYVSIHSEIKGILTALDIFEDYYYEGGLETEKEYQIISMVKKLLFIAEDELRVNNNDFDVYMMKENNKEIEKILEGIVK